MGKPLIHIIPSQEAKLRGSLSASNAQAAAEDGAKWKGKKLQTSSRLTKGNGIRRSTTNSTSGSNTSWKSNRSHDSGACSFVHSNASLSSSQDDNMTPLYTTTTVKNNHTFVPNTITTSLTGASPASRTNKVKLTIQNHEQNFEITRQNSIAASTSASTTSSSKRRFHKNFSTNKSTHSGGNSSQKTGDDSTISSMTTYRTSSFGSNNRFRPTADQGAIPRFEVLLDETPTKEISPIQKATPSRKPMKINTIANCKEEESGFEVGFSSTNDSPDISQVKQRVMINRQRSPSTRSRQRQLSEGVTSSSQFFSAMDKHVATKTNRPHRIRKVVHSVEVVKSSKVEEDDVVVCEDAMTSVSETDRPRRPSRASEFHRVLSPSKTKGAREIPSVAAASFKVQPLRRSDPMRKKTMYSIGERGVVAHDFDEYEAIELKESGSVISNQAEIGNARKYPAVKTKQDNAKRRYHSMRLDSAGMLHNSQSKAPTSSRIAKGFRRLTFRSKNASSSTLSQNPIRVVSEDDNIGAIELVRTSTVLGPSNTFSYDENDEDPIIKPVSPIPSSRALHIVGENDDIEIVASSSEHKSDAGVTTPIVDESMDRIVSIRKLSSQDENSPSFSTTVRIETISPVRSLSSTPPKKIEPFVEIPSNRAEGTIDGTSVSSNSTRSAASAHSRSSAKSSADGSTKLPMQTEEETPRNGDQLIFVGNEHSSVQIQKSTLVPKIPAPKRDTVSKKAKILKKSSYETKQKFSSSSMESPGRKVKIQVQSVQKPDDNVQNIEISSVATPTSTESDDVPLTKYATMVVKKPSFTAEAQDEMPLEKSEDAITEKCIVSVNVLGVAGIVVDRSKCRDSTGNNCSPFPPDKVAAVIGIVECDKDSVEEVTAFSSPLVHAPNTKDTPETKTETEVQRHIAVWASNEKGETPGSIVKSTMLNLKSTGKKFLDMKVALTKTSDSDHHTAVVIGRARVEITADMIGESNNRTIDVPVSQLQGSSQSVENQVLLLRNSSKPRDDFKKLSVDEFSSFGIEDQENFASAYAIDPTGDSMVRVQVQVLEVSPSSTDEKVERSGSFTNRTERTSKTERSEESSNVSGLSKTETDKVMYSEQLQFASQFEEDVASELNSKKDEVLTSYKTSERFGILGCKMFGKRIDLYSCTPRSKVGLASRFDGRLEDLTQRIFSSNCTGPKADDASVAGDETYYTSGTGISSIPAVSTVPTMTELRDLAKDIALSGGGILFKEEEDIDERTVSEDEADNFDDGSGTKKSAETWEKKSDGDDGSFSSAGSATTSEGSLSLNHQEPVKFSFDAQRRVVSENNKFDVRKPSEDLRFSLGRSFGEDPEDEIEDTQSVADDDGYKDFNFLRENSGKPSLPSVVENIAEVLSIGGKACGYFSEQDVDPNASSSLIWSRTTGEVEIPKTVDQSDHQSVGELTAMTLEKDVIKEKNRKLLMKKLGLPKEILSWSAVGKSEVEGADEEESQFESARAASANPENYFAEYEDGPEGARSTYGSTSELSKQGEENREDELQTAGEETLEDKSIEGNRGKAEVDSV